jgi:hypothetical protein
LTARPSEFLIHASEAATSAAASATATGSAPADDAALLTCIREKNFDNAAEEHVQLHQHLQQDL